MVDSLFLPDIPITSSDFWQSEDECTLDVLRHVFRSTTDEEIPLLEERLACLREAGQVLYEVMLIHSLFVRNMLSKGMLACSYWVMCLSLLLGSLLSRVHQCGKGPCQSNYNGGGVAFDMHQSHTKAVSENALLTQF